MRIVILLASFILYGCAVSNQNKTLAELDASYEDNIKASTRIYKNKNPIQVREAAYKVLSLLDPDDIKFDIKEGGLMATRFNTYYAVLAVGSGRDWYSVDIQKNGSGSIVRFGFYGELNHGLIVQPIAESYKSNIPVGAHNSTNDYNLFFDRLDYFLGINSTWETCDLAKAKLKDKNSKLFLCDQLGLENKNP